jgi:hypothetical protein
MQNVEHRGHSTRHCAYWTEYLRYVKYVKGDENAMASDVSDGKTIALTYEM